MAGIRIERYGRYGRSKRRGSTAQIGCGCTIIAGFAMLFLCVGLYSVGALTTIVLQVTGVERIGDTDAQFIETSTVNAVVVSPQNAQIQTRAIFDLGVEGREIVDVDSRDYVIVTGDGENSLQAATATFSEIALLDLCARRSMVCRDGTDQFKSVRFDLRPGGAIIYADVNTGLFWQRIGLVLRLTGDNTNFELVGVDVDGSTYDVTTLPAFIPAETRETINVAVNDIERVGNQVLRDMVLLASGEDYRLANIVINDTTLMLIMQG